MIVGLDVGGTNIDLVVLKDFKIVKYYKRPVNNNLNISLKSLIDELLNDFDVNLIKQINLSTTISTNLIMTNNIEEVLMIIQNGLGLSNSHYQIGNHSFFVSGYTDHRGHVLTNFETKEIKEITKYLNKHKLTNVCINTKFSIRNQSVENEIASFFKNYNVTLGSKVSDTLNFKRRIVTSYLNAGISNTYNEFYKSVLSSTNNLNINILKADGSLITLEENSERPVESIGSGPAASLLGMLSIFDFSKIQKYLLLDIGGTTTDIFFSVGSNYLTMPKGLEIKDYLTNVKSVYFKSLPFGGDTAISFENGSFQILEKRVDGPVSLGGSYLTITDCLNVLGKSDVGDISLSLKALDEEAKLFNISSIKLADKIVKEMITSLKTYINELLIEINSKPIYTINELINFKEFDFDEIKVIGGPALALKEYLSEVFFKKISVNKHFLYANAIGSAVASHSKALTIYADTEQGYLTIPKLNVKEPINKLFTLADAAIKLQSYFKEDDKLEVISQSLFNMVDGFYTKGHNIRVTMQVKPKILSKVGDFDE